MKLSIRTFPGKKIKEMAGTPRTIYEFLHHHPFLAGFGIVIVGQTTTSCLSTCFEALGGLYTPDSRVSKLERDVRLERYKSQNMSNTMFSICDDAVKKGSIDRETFVVISKLHDWKNSDVSSSET